VGGLAAGAWFLGPWRGKAAPRNVVVVPPPPPPDTTTPAAVSPSRPSDRPSREDRRAALNALRSDSAVRELRANARAARERAVTAGATSTDLAPGDAERRTADQVVGRDRQVEVMSHLGAAIGLWAAAEQTARARAQQAAVTPPVTQPPPVTTAPPPPPAPENPRPLIEAAIQGYARALESRDVQQVRRAYPGLTPQQAQVWRDFFGMVTDLKVDLAIKQLQIAGDVAEAQVEGVSQYLQSRRPQRQPVSFHATLDHASGAWRIASIR